MNESSSEPQKPRTRTITLSPPSELRGLTLERETGSLYTRNLLSTIGRLSSQNYSLCGYWGVSEVCTEEETTALSEVLRARLQQNASSFENFQLPLA